MTNRNPLDEPVPGIERWTSLRTILAQLTDEQRDALTASVVWVVGNVCDTDMLAERLADKIITAICEGS